VCLQYPRECRIRVDVVLRLPCPCARARACTCVNVHASTCRVSACSWHLTTRRLCRHLRLRSSRLLRPAPAMRRCRHAPPARRVHVARGIPVGWAVVRACERMCARACDSVRVFESVCVRAPWRHLLPGVQDIMEGGLAEPPPACVFFFAFAIAEGVLAAEESALYDDAAVRTRLVKFAVPRARNRLASVLHHAGGSKRSQRITPIVGGVDGPNRVSKSVDTFASCACKKQNR
jgi:hypothetical protein